MFSSGIVIIIRLGQKVSSRGVACDEFIVKLLWIPVFSQIISHPISLPHENTKWHAKSIILRLPYPLANSLFIKPAEKSFFAAAAAQNCYVSIWWPRSWEWDPLTYQFSTFIPLLSCPGYCNGQQSNLQLEIWNSNSDYIPCGPSMMENLWTRQGFLINRSLFWFCFPNKFINRNSRKWRVLSCSTHLALSNRLELISTPDISVWTFHHGDFLAQGHFGMRKFQHGYFSAPWTFWHRDVTTLRHLGTRIFWHMDILAQGPKCLC